MDSTVMTDRRLWHAVVGSVSLVGVLLVGLVTLGIVLGGGLSTLPYTYRLMLDPSPREDPGSQSPLVMELETAFPGSRVALTATGVAVTGRRADLSFGRLATTLQRRGFRIERFRMGWDFRPSALIGNVASRPDLLVIFFAGAPLCFGLVGFLYRRRHTVEQRDRPLAPALLWGLIGGAGMLAAAYGLARILGRLGWTVSEQTVLADLATSGPWAVATLCLAAVVLAPVGEELFFRGWLFSALNRSGRRFWAYAISALLFTSAHLFLPAAPIYLLFGVCLAALYERARSVVAPIVAHAVVNTVAVITLVH